jgi:hypothetical protein
MPRRARPLDDRLDDVRVHDRQPRPERLAGDRPQPVDRLAGGEEREVRSEQELVVDPVLDGLHERVEEQPPSGGERRHVGVDVRVPAHHRDRLLEPRMAHVRDHDPELGVAQRDLVQEDRARPEQRPRARERRPLVDEERQPEPLERRAHAEELGPQRVDALVDRPHLAADEPEVGRHPLELVERGR